jgi:hypothetical protein
MRGSFYGTYSTPDRPIERSQQAQDFLATLDSPNVTPVTYTDEATYLQFEDGSSSWAYVAGDRWLKAPTPAGYNDDGTKKD